MILETLLRCDDRGRRYYKEEEKVKRQKEKAKQKKEKKKAKHREEKERKNTTKAEKKGLSRRDWSDSDS